MTDLIVDVQRVTKRFHRRTAVDAISLQLRPGRIMALVGPNGSGKTTLLKLLAGFLRPTDGIVRVLNRDPVRDRPAVMEHARFAFAPPALYPNLTARETLRALADMTAPRGRRPDDPHVDAALETVGLTDRADDVLRVYSFGMRQRLALAQAIIPMPRLLVLDEPTDGLDPLAIIELRHSLKALRDDHGVTILLSSHLIVEVEKLVDDLLLLSEGRSLFCGPPAELLDSVRRADPSAQRILRLRFDGEDHPAKRAADMLRDRGIPSAMTGRDELELPAGAIALRDAVDLFTGNGIALRAYDEPALTLEDALLARLRDGDAGSSGERSAPPRDQPPSEAP